MYYLPLAAALAVGLAAALLLEAAWQRHRGGSRPWLWAGLALGCFCLAWVSWGMGTPQKTIMPLTAPLARPEPLLPATAVPPLPPPLVTQFTPAASSPLWQAASQPNPAPRPPTRLRIPVLQIDRAIVPVPVRDAAWDVAALGQNVGLLATTGAHAGDRLAMVFAGHMTFPDGRLLFEGAFANLPTITYGTEVLLEGEAGTAVYRVQAIGRVPPAAVDQLYLADGDSILLVTCTDWDAASGTYANRFIVRAVWVEADES